MVNFFDKIYSKIVGKNKILNKIRFYSAIRLIIRVFANYFIPLYFQCTYRNKSFALLSNHPKNPKIIVSITSFPGRINKIWLVIETILRQTVKPDKIILWLSKEQFPSLGILPQKLLKQRVRGLEIYLKDGDLYSHKKYFYTLQEFPQDIMITMDDDVFYPNNVIEQLLNWSKVYKNAIIARYGSKIKFEMNKITEYNNWQSSYFQELPDYYSFFGSGGGALFPPQSLPIETLDKDVFMRISLLADDVWLNAMCRLKKTKVLKITENCSLLPIIHKNKSSLQQRNLGEKLNDKQLHDVRSYFILKKGIDPFNFEEF